MTDSSAKTRTLIAINGFLGRTSDWPEALAPAGWAFKPWPIEDLVDFETWADRFCADVRREVSGERVLIGYSMGGRLAMHALIKDPSLFEGGILVSANPGLFTDEERRLRVATDDVWAKKFLNDPWPSLMTEWNTQVALRPPHDPGPDSIDFVRNEADFSRATLAKTLRTFSLGLQRNLRPDLARLKMPITFVTGEDDVKFTSIARDLARETGHPHAVVKRAGHRVPWDAPTQMREIIAGFLRTV